MCESNDCGLHGRNDVETVDTVDGMEFITRVSYHGEWAILTDDNMMAGFMMLMGKPMLPHYTMVIKVGDDPVIANGNDSLDGRVYDLFLSANVTDARNAHTMAAYGIESGIMKYDTPISVKEAMLKY